MMGAARTLSISAAGSSLEAEWHGPPPERAPTLVLLHEGLGCVTMWKAFPQMLAAHTGFGVLVYSRRGYGQSDPRPLPWPASYMHDEAFYVLPAVLDQAGVRKAILVGHSDGASIATIYAGLRQDFRVRGLALLAPHFFVEELSLRSIAAATEAYERGDLRQRLARHHRDVDVAFRGWNEVWLSPEFRAWRLDDALAHIRVPMLIIQGLQDQYGTVAQVELAQQESYCPVETLMLEACGHSPQIDRTEETFAAIAEFAHRILVLHEGRAGNA
jgi:pimeloyl-ACP methyl ester carboxylesterase